jgi:hypothetical protein
MLANADYFAPDSTDWWGLFEVAGLVHWLVVSCITGSDRKYDYDQRKSSTNSVDFLKHEGSLGWSRLFSSSNIVCGSVSILWNQVYLNLLAI